MYGRYAPAKQRELLKFLTEKLKQAGVAPSVIRRFKYETRNAVTLEQALKEVKAGSSSAASAPKKEKVVRSEAQQRRWTREGGTATRLAMLRGKGEGSYFSKESRWFGVGREPKETELMRIQRETREAIAKAAKGPQGGSRGKGRENPPPPPMLLRR
jgi:hypothetical protein